MTKVNILNKEDPEVRKKLGARLKAVRLARRMTIQHVATHFKVSEQHVLRVEGGQHSLKASELVLLARFYNIPFKKLTDGLCAAASTTVAESSMIHKLQQHQLH